MVDNDTKQKKSHIAWMYESANIQGFFVFG
jgi:hypothetical protein